MTDIVTKERFCVQHGGKAEDFDQRDAWWLCDICARAGINPCSCGAPARRFGEALFNSVHCEACTQFVAGVEIDAETLWNAGVRGLQEK